MLFALSFFHSRVHALTEILLQNHTATQAFISRIESFCPTLHHLQYLRNHTAYSSFEKMWQLPVYFQLRLKEIVGALEESLAARDAAGEFLRLLEQHEDLY